MKLTDYSKDKPMTFEPTNPKVVYDSKTKYYNIDYDAVYDDGHIEKHTGFGSHNLDIIEEYLRDIQNPSL